MDVVIIRTKSCPKCHALIPEFLEKVGKLSEDIKILTLGVNEEAMDYIQDYNIVQAPTFIIYKEKEPKIFSGDVLVNEIINYMSSTN